MTRTVVHFTDSDIFGGTERVIAQLLGATDRNQWRPVLFHHDEPGIAELIEYANELKIEQHVLPRMMTVRDLTKQRPFIKALKQVQADVFHAHLSWPLSCKYGLLAAKRAGIPAIIATAHGRMDLSQRPLLRFQPQLISKTVDRYLAVSRGVADQLSGTFRIPKQKIEIAPNGVDLEAYNCIRNLSLRETLTGGNNAPIILTVARLSGQKGHDDLLQAATQLPDAVFLFAGNGPERPRLEKLSGQLAISDRIRFLGHRSDIPALLSCCDLFVLPSLTEGMPLTILEAMAARVPVITTDIPGNNELVTDGKTGTLTPIQSPNALARSIKDALDDQTKTGRMTDEAYEMVSQHYSLEQTANRVALAYEQLLSQKEQDSRP